MDKKIRNAAIASVIVAALLILSTVLLVNFLQNPGKDSQQTSRPIIEDVSAETDEKGFLKDPAFLDEYQPFAGEVREDGKVKLNLLVSSVERDLRVMVIDEQGAAVEGEKFFVTVDGIGEYKDLDADGFIYIGGIKPGSYYVSLEEIGDYEVPDKVKVNVKDKIEFVKLDDISYLIKTEDEIDAEAEDTANHQVDSDESEHTGAWDSEQNAVLGIDVSKWNQNIDWNKVKEAGVQFVIIRCGYRGSKTGVLVEDPYFRQNIKEAKEAGLKVGVYFFTQAINQAEAVEEASMVLSLTEGYELDYPIFIDTEGSGGRADTLDAVTRTAVCEAFCETVEQAGQEAGVYASRNWYYNNVDDDVSSRYTIWVAEYRKEPLYTGRYDIWQYTSSGQIDGIDGRVDLNLSYIH
jgi:GH25 family lysozyme M1 (1,4-beta-N-acetylmuramidase)